MFDIGHLSLTRTFTKRLKVCSNFGVSIKDETNYNFHRNEICAYFWPSFIILTDDFRLRSPPSSF